VTRGQLTDPDIVLIAWGEVEGETTADGLTGEGCAGGEAGSGSERGG